jgi:hypothetical protein
MATTEFDQIFEEMSVPEYPATCDQCGEAGTNASMESHDCNQTGQCNACAAIVPRDELRTGMPAAGVEGAFCAKCRGEKSEPIPLPLYARVNVAEKTYDIFNAQKLLVAAFASREEAEYLIKSANSHAQLVAALRGLMTRFEQTGEAWMSDPAWIAANEALSRVRG